MNRYDRGAAIGMTHEVVTAFDAGHREARPAKSRHQLLPRD